MMDLFPLDPKKIRERIRRYERALRKEQEEFGVISDGYGKRYLLGPLYLLLDDTEGALKSFAWFEKTFPDDSGEPMHWLCWTLALYRSGDLETSARRLRRAMFSNLYLIPRLLGLAQEELDIWHGSNFAELAYAEDIPPALFALWDAAALEWVREAYNVPDLRQDRERYIAIHHELRTEPRGARRTQLVDEAFELQYNS